MERVAEITGQTPPALAARPALAPWLGSALAAFGLLNGSRGAGYGGPLPIPLTEIESYCRLFAISDPEEVAELVELIQAMDATYLEAATRRSERESEAPPVSVNGDGTGARPIRRARRRG